MGPIIIVGAGITGCVTGYELVRKGLEVIIIENDTRIGGLAKTFQYGDFLFDIGPHRFFAQKKPTADFIFQILKNDYTIIPRHSEVYFSGRYYSWPLRPSAFFNLPFKIMLKSAWDIFFMVIRGKRKSPDVFEDYVLMHYGLSLYNIFFRDYTQKFLALSPRDVHADWAREGMKRAVIDETIASRNLLDILKLLFLFQSTLTEFIYPVSGMGIFCKRLAEEIKRQGGEIWTSSSITDVRYSADTVEEITVNGKRIRVDQIIWTGPLVEVCKLLKLPCRGLDYLSLLLFNIEINQPIQKDYQWCYYGSKDIIFSRVSVPQFFYEKTVPEGKGSLCVEVTCRSTDLEWSNPQLFWERVKQDLVKVGLISEAREIENVHIEKVPNAYPIYLRHYLDDLKKVKEDLAVFSNLVLAGRTGLFWYNNMDDCIENGLLVAREIYRRNNIR